MYVNISVGKFTKKGLNMNQREIGFAVIGCGGIATKAHLPSISEIPEGKLIAVADAVKEKAKGAAERFGAKAYYTDYRKLLKREDVDVVDVCTPPFMHREQVVAAAEAGKHIICEKPLCTTLTATDEIIRAVKKAEVKLTVDFMFRFHPLYRKVKQIIDDGSIGKVVMMWLTNIVMTNPTHPWFWKKEKSGGMLVEHTCHFFDIFTWWAGEPDTVFAWIRTVNPEASIEDNASVAIKYRNQGMGVVAQSFGSSFEITHVGVLGEKGTAELSGGWYPTRLRFKTEGQPRKEMHASAATRAYKNLIQHFAKCVIEDEQPLVTGNDGKAALEVALASYRSAEKGVPVSIS